MKGKFVVIEGADGSGKSSQLTLLEKFLKQKKVRHQVIIFPRYGQNPYAKLVYSYLNGEFGKVSEIDPHLISLTYAGDRMLSAPLVREWLRDLKLVISSRYVHSNVAYSLARMEEKKQQPFTKWSYDIEYKTNNIPKEDLVILLNVDPKVAQKNIKGKNKDLHEKDFSYQKQVIKAYLKLAKSQKNWVIIECSKNGQMRSKDQINKEIIEILTKKGII